MVQKMNCATVANNWVVRDPYLLQRLLEIPFYDFQLKLVIFRHHARALKGKYYLRFYSCSILESILLIGISAHFFMP